MCFTEKQEEQIKALIRERQSIEDGIKEAAIYGRETKPAELGEDLAINTMHILG